MKLPKLTASIARDSLTVIYKEPNAATSSIHPSDVGWSPQPVCERRCEGTKGRYKCCKYDESCTQDDNGVPFCYG